MALTEHHRNTLYQGLTQAVGDEEAVAAMLSQFPAREVDEPATKDFVSGFVRSELLAQESRMRDELATKDFVRAQVTDLEKRMVEGFADLKDHVHQEMRHYMLWSYGAMFILLAAVVTAAKILQ